MLLSLVNVAKRYGVQDVLQPTTLSVRSEEIVAVLGPSGCGKSTLLGIVAGLVTPTLGEVVLDGALLNSVPTERRGIPMVFQDPLLFPGMTVTENVAFGLRARGVPRSERNARVASVLSAVHLDGLGARYPAELSGGQRQRVSLARAIVLIPRLVLLDEPFSSLDSMLRQEMRELVMRMQREYGFSALIVTHDPQEAMEMADRIVVMRAGHVEQSGRPEDLYRRPANAFVARFLGPANILPSASGPFCVRPDAIRFSRGEPGVSGKVVQRRFAGSGIELCIDSDLGLIRAIGSTPDFLEAEIGMPVVVSWREQDTVPLEVDRQKQKSNRGFE